MGNSRKIHYIPQTAFQNSEDRGGLHGGKLMIGILIAWGVFISGISSGDGHECIP